MMHRLVESYRTALNLVAPERWLTRRFIRRHLAARLSPSGACIDLGGGNAPFRPVLSAVRPAARHIVVDRVAGDCTDVAADAHRLPFASGRADVVAMFQVVQFFDHPAAALAECRRVLHSDGLLLMTYPFMTSEGRSHDLRRWSTRGMEIELKAAGFEPVAHETLGGPCFFVTATLSGLPGRLLIAHRQGWRTGRSAADAFRLGLAFGLSLPFHFLGFPASWLDRAVRRPAHYLGGIVLARKLSDA